MEFKEVEKILNTLPISYYLKKKANVVLSEEAETSSIDLFTGNIEISFKQIQSTTDDLEKEVRVKLYHEISHALLSPLPIKLTIDKDIYNIFEDERIETLLSYYYLDVDFKRNLLSKYKNYIPSDPKGIFFYYVRLRGGGPILNKEIDRLILKWQKLRYSPKPQPTYFYEKDIQALYQKIIKLHNTRETELNPIFENYSLQNAQLGEGSIEQIISSVYSKLEIYKDVDFQKKASLIINSRRKTNANNSEAKKTYSGKINPRVIRKPNDDYKWFFKKGDGLFKKYKGLKLNLFIDQSGSFSKNEVAVNSMLKELDTLTHKIKDFDFDLITIDTDIEIRPKKKRYIKCKGGNCLPSKINDIFKSVQKSDSEVINIVLFHGDIATDWYSDSVERLRAFSDEQYQNLKCFNKKNVIIISDYSNQVNVDKYCPKCKRIYTYHYVDELKSNVLKSLKILAKTY